MLEDVIHIFETYRRVRNEVIRESGDPANDYLLEGKGPPYVEGPNHYYGKTVSGYVVEYYYGAPNKVHTPDGEYTWFRGNCMIPPRDLREKIDARFIKALGLVLGREKQYTTGPCGGEVGPFYAVVGTPDFVVPEVSSPLLDGHEPDSSTKLSILHVLLEIAAQKSQPTARGERLTKSRHGGE